jgi:hypothetical protein
MMQYSTLSWIEKCTGERVGMCAWFGTWSTHTTDSSSLIKLPRQGSKELQFKPVPLQDLHSQLPPRKIAKSDLMKSDLNLTRFKF